MKIVSAAISSFRMGLLARARETEEDGRLALFVRVGRAVHRSDALQRQQVGREEAM